MDVPAANARDRCGTERAMAHVLLWLDTSHGAPMESESDQWLCVGERDPGVCACGRSNSVLGSGHGPDSPPDVEL